MHRGRSAYNHLLCLAQTQGLPPAGWTRSSPHRADLGGQEAGGRLLARHGAAARDRAALLGDPKVLLLDEPVNGLDPEGVIWVRNLMKQLAAEGRTVFVSSHLMNEMSVTADHLIVIGRGRLLADCSAAEFIDRHSRQQVLVKTTDPALLGQMLAGEGGHVTPTETGALTVTGVPAARIGELATWARLVIHELTPQHASLEQAFMQMTADSQEFGAREPVPARSHQGSTP